jgi:hypothetical protein
VRIPSAATACAMPAGRNPAPITFRQTREKIGKFALLNPLRMIKFSWSSRPSPSF